MIMRDHSQVCDYCKVRLAKEEDDNLVVIIKDVSNIRKEDWPDEIKSCRSNSLFYIFCKECGLIFFKQLELFCNEKGFPVKKEPEE